MTNVNRKHPRVYMKKTEGSTNKSEEKVIDLNAPAAIGIIAFAFLNGILLGALLKR